MPTRTPSIISMVMTVVLLLLLGALVIFVLLILLNGFSEREGGPALVTALVCQSVGVLSAAVLAWKLPRWLSEKFQWNKALSVAIAVAGGLVVGGAISFTSIVAALIVAETLWK